MKTKGVLHLTVRRVADIERALYYTMSRYAYYRAGNQPKEIYIKVKPRAKKVSRLR